MSAGKWSGEEAPETSQRWTSTVCLCLLVQRTPKDASDGGSPSLNRERERNACLSADDVCP
jgi:hypothetical protein